MQYLGGLQVIPQLPTKIKRLKDLAYNLYFSWHPEVRDLFIEIDRNLWKKTNHNPVKFLFEVQQKKLEAKASDPVYLKNYQEVINEFDHYLNLKNTWFTKNYPKLKNLLVAYFTAEFGFHESLPIYAGGLGVLAGDHLKSASDLGIPVVGISLFYHQTYFTQEIDAHGNQIAHYNNLNPLELPLQLVRDRKNDPLLVLVNIGSHKVFIRIWEAKVGRRSAFLLDTNVPQNQAQDREITSRLYGGDQEMRIAQEIILGMGGVLVLEALGISPTVWHMNEGHSVFLALQRTQKLVKENKLKFYEALESVTSNTIFTTHTPVPAGNDAFPLHIKDKYFQKYWESVGIRRHQFLELGSQIQPEGYEIFNLTILALNLSRFRNAVSKLHGEVSQSLWNTVWPDLPYYEVPIDYITNGVHAESWISRRTRLLYKKYLGDNWIEMQDDPAIWKMVDKIPDQNIWSLKLELKKKLINHIRERLEIQYERNKIGSIQMFRIRQLLKPDILTIGFARRFATYKRGTLIFSDLERLKKILNNPKFPVQFIFAGKAHPKDTGGQDLIKQIYQYSVGSELRGKIIFVENYDMGLARDLVSGVDVWLNNPRRTQEASGTSGQKVGMNGGLNFSVLDGWWNEGYTGENGWAFGETENFESPEDWDSWDSEELYEILENEIIPLYYRRNEENIPSEWIKMVKNSLKRIIPYFNTHRMIKEYLQKLYQPANDLGYSYQQKQHAVAKSIAAWKDRIDKHWSSVSIGPLHPAANENGSVILKFGEKYEIQAKVKLGELRPSEVKVQIFLSKDDSDLDEIKSYEIFEMNLVKGKQKDYHTYRALIKPSNSGNYYVTLRVLPFHKNLPNPVELGIVQWFQK